jgi:hypothetical protein
MWNAPTVTLDDPRPVGGASFVSTASDGQALTQRSSFEGAFQVDCRTISFGSTAISGT